jgi:curved DNA-binding protein CbpA
MPSSNATTTSKDCLYRILRVSPTATLSEIKLAYYQVAQQLHPDKHNGCSTKLESFKQVNEAYSILSDHSKRQAYDFQQGHFNNNTHYRRSKTAPKDYRKVHMPRPPPHWKTVWDHAKHYEMHYGDGMQKEAMKQAMKTAEREGAFEYHSPLGKGFTFDHAANTNTNTSGVDSNNDSLLHGALYNPYSKRTPQGPPKVVFEYTEGHNLNGHRESIVRHERIVRDMHTRRHERVQKQTATSSSNTAAATARRRRQQHEQQQQRPFSSPENAQSHHPAWNNNCPPRSQDSSLSSSSSSSYSASSTRAPQWPYTLYQTESTTTTTRTDQTEKEACIVM